MKQTYTRTLTACYTGYVVQAIVNNFAPLLFLTFQSTYGISMGRITLLITINFIIQLMTDFLSAGFVDRIGYRASMLIAHAASAAGLICLPLLPELLPDPFAGLLIAVGIYAVGGGLLEVLVSPVVEALPTKNKEKTMSMLHSFYCWGHVAVVLLSTVFFALFGVENWRIMAVLWALVPIYNLFVFCKVPMCTLTEEGEKGLSFADLVRRPAFWILMIVMVCAGASEQSVSQWASTFAEQGLGVSKTIGDLTGPMFFAVCMGSSRLLYGLYGEKLNLKRAMILSGLLCILSYCMISLSPIPALSLLGCGVCGFSVGIMWPGAFSIGASVLKGGGTVMFAFFALAGDLGCSGGPTYVGLISEYAGNSLKTGIQWAVIFPLLLISQPVGIYLRGTGTGCQQNDRRSDRTYVFRRLHGQFPAALWAVRGKTEPETGNDPERAVMHPLLLHDLTLADSRVKPPRMRCLRFLRRDHVAGRIQYRRIRIKGRRHSDVCILRPCR